MVLESYLGSLIRRFLEKYVSSIDLRGLNLWGGKITLSNFELNLLALQESSNLPVIFTRGFVNLMEITVPWRQLGSEPVVVNINSIELVMVPASASEGDHEVDGEKTRSVKSGSLDHPTSTPSSSAASSSNPSTSASDSSGDASADSWTNILLKKIYMNIRINIRNVVVKYADHQSKFVASVLLKELSLFTANNLWRPSFIQDIKLDAINLLRRVITVVDFTLCIDDLVPDDPAVASSADVELKTGLVGLGAADKDKGSRSRSSSLNTRVVAYSEPVIRRVNIEARLLSSSQRTIQHLDVHLDALNLTATEAQYNHFITFLLVFFSSNKAKDVVGSQGSLDGEDVTTVAAGRGGMAALSIAESDSVTAIQPPARGLLVTLFISSATAVLAKPRVVSELGCQGVSPLSILHFTGFLFQYESIVSSLSSESGSEITISAGSCSIVNPTSNNSTVLSVDLVGDAPSHTSAVLARPSEVCYHCGRCIFESPLSRSIVRGGSFGSFGVLNDNTVWKQIPEDSSITLVLHRQRGQLETGLTSQPLSLAFTIGYISLVFIEHVLIDHTILFLLSPFPSLLEPDPSVRTATRRCHKLTNTLTSFDLSFRVARLVIIWPPERGGGPAVLLNGSSESRPIYVDAGSLDIRLAPKSLVPSDIVKDGLPPCIYSILNEHHWQSTLPLPGSQTQNPLPVLRLAISKRANVVVPPSNVTRLEAENRILKQRDIAANAEISSLSATVDALRTMLTLSPQSRVEEARQVAAVSWRAGRRSPFIDAEMGDRSDEKMYQTSTVVNQNGSFWDRLWIRGRPFIIIYLVLIHVILPYAIFYRSMTSAGSSSHSALSDRLEVQHDSRYL